MHTVVLAFHHCHLTFALCHHIDDTAGRLFREIDSKLLNRFAFYTVNFFNDYLRLTDLQFVSFTTHRFNQHRQVEHATAIYQP